MRRTDAWGRSLSCCMAARFGFTPKIQQRMLDYGFRLALGKKTHLRGTRQHVHNAVPARVTRRTSTGQSLPVERSKRQELPEEDPA